MHGWLTLSVAEGEVISLVVEPVISSELKPNFCPHDQNEHVVYVESTIGARDLVHLDTTHDDDDLRCKRPRDRHEALVCLDIWRPISLTLALMPSPVVPVSSTLRARRHAVSCAAGRSSPMRLSAFTRMTPSFSPRPPRLRSALR